LSDGTEVVTKLENATLINSCSDARLESEEILELGSANADIRWRAT
jgi:carbonic anhydrase